MKISRQNPPRVGDVIEFFKAEDYRGWRQPIKQEVIQVLVLEDPDLSLLKSSDWVVIECLDLTTNAKDVFGFDLRLENFYTIISRTE